MNMKRRNMDKILKQYYQLYKKLIDKENSKIPLCAAETHISPFCKQPLNSLFEGKYSFVDKMGNDSFIGGECVFELNLLLKQACKKIFNADYANADSLTGINCFSVCAMSLLTRKDYVLLTTPEQGGHASIPVILDSLGVKYDSIPYNYDNYQINYTTLNEMIATKKYTFLIFCQSDLIYPPDITRININDNMGIIYDGTQTLGMIAGKILDNPLDNKNVVLIGGAHKTLPAPSCGLIMTNNDLYAQKLQNNITPNYLRNTQPNHIAALLLCLVEQDKFGKEYQFKTVQLANCLGKALENKQFNIAKIDEDRYTYTHQLFILMSEKDTDKFYLTAKKYNISLNQKHKQLFNNDGIRIGTQQISRYNWCNAEIERLAELLHLLKNPDINKDKILKLREYLIAKKIPQFEYENIIIK